MECWGLVKSHLFKFSVSAHLEEDIWYGEHFLSKIRQVWLKWRESKMHRNILKSWKKVVFHSWLIITRMVQYSSKKNLHTKLITKWLRHHNIATLSWHTMFPDLNPYEDLWDILARQVYADGIRFDGLVWFLCLMAYQPSCVI